MLEQAESWWPSPDFSQRVDELLSELATQPDYARAFVTSAASSPGDTANEGTAIEPGDRPICEYENQLTVRCIDGVIHDQWGPLARTCPVCFGHGRSK